MSNYLTKQFDSQKIIYHPNWMRRFRLDPFSLPPIYIELSMEGRCNHRCTFCAKDVMQYPNRRIPMSLYEQLVKELKNLRLQDPDGLGVKSFMFAGEGEPTLYKQLDKAIIFADTSGIDTALTTNATGMTQKFVEHTLPHLKWIKASINAGTKKTHHLVHQTPNESHWDIIWRNLEYAVKERNRLGLLCEIGCQTVLLVQDTLDLQGRLVPANWQEAPLLAQRAKDAGLDHVVVKPYGQNPYSLGSMNRYGSMVYSEFIDALEEIDREMAKLNDENFHVVFRWKTIFSHDDQERGYPICLSTPTAWAYLQSDGMLLSCAAHNSNPDFDLGNIKTASFSEIWWGERRRKHMQFMQAFDVSQCRKNCRMHWVNTALSELGNLSDTEFENNLVKANSESSPRNVNFI